LVKKIDLILGILILIYTILINIIFGKISFREALAVIKSYIIDIKLYDM